MGKCFSRKVLDEEDQERLGGSDRRMEGPKFPERKYSSEIIGIEFPPSEKRRKKRRKKKDVGAKRNVFVITLITRSKKFLQLSFVLNWSKFALSSFCPNKPDCFPTEAFR